MSDTIEIPDGRTISLAELEAALAKMTPAPWRSNIQWLHGDAAGIGPWSRAGYACTEDGTSADCSQAWRDADGITLLRNSATALVAEVRRLRAEVTRLKADPDYPKVYDSLGRCGEEGCPCHIKASAKIAAARITTLEGELRAAEAEVEQQKHIISGHTEARRMLAEDIVALGTGKPTKLELSRGADRRIAALEASRDAALDELRAARAERDAAMVAADAVVATVWTTPSGNNHVKDGQGPAFRIAIDNLRDVLSIRSRGTAPLASTHEPDVKPDETNQ